MRKSIFKNLLFSLLTLFLFYGCDKNDLEPLPCLITSSTSTGGGYTYVHNLVYDNRKAVSGINTSQTPNGSTTQNVTYAYNSEGNLSEIVYSPSVREVFTYTNGEITKKETFNNSKLTDQTDYEYTKEQLTKIQEYRVTSGTTSLEKEVYQTFEFATPSDTNPVRAQYFRSPGSTVPANTSEFTYSEQKGAFAAAPAGLLKYFKTNGQSTDKAISKQVIISTGPTQTITYAYEFNADGFPTTRIETYSIGLLQRATTYTYQCDKG